MGADLPGVSARAPVKSDIACSSSITWNSLAHVELGAGAANQLCGRGYFTLFAEQVILEVTLCFLSLIDVRTVILGMMDAVLPLQSHKFCSFHLLLLFLALGSLLLTQPA